MKYGVFSLHFEREVTWRYPRRFRLSNEHAWWLRVNLNVWIALVESQVCATALSWRVKYLILPFLRFGGEAKRGVELRHKARVWWKVSLWERDVLTLGSEVLSAYYALCGSRERAWSKTNRNKLFEFLRSNKTDRGVEFRHLLVVKATYMLLKSSKIELLRFFYTRIIIYRYLQQIITHILIKFYLLYYFVNINYKKTI